MLTMSSTVWGQTNSPLVYYGSGWNMIGWQINPGTGFPGVMDHYRFYFLGDSTINSYQYHKLYFNFNRYINGWGSSMAPDSFNYVGAFRDSGLQYYFLPEDSVNEKLIYDFSLSVNDTAPIGYHLNQSHFRIIVGSTPLALLDGSTRTRYSYGLMDSAGNYNGYGWIIDGIGDHLGLIDSVLYVKDFYDGGTETYSYCEGGNLLYKVSGISVPVANICDFPLSIADPSLPESFVLYPNPSDGMINLFFPESQIVDVVNIFNTTGNLVYQFKVSESNSVNLTLNLPGGLYVIQWFNGNKSISGKLLIN